ncbi:hypothetical protein BX666DRAFT_2031568 [Dichotomocladium elegans]|nr:hypothetical protein BX666DRAFT_2031568 [Dichotomocladium elegans]
MTTLLVNLKKAVSLADQAVALILYDDNIMAPMKTLQEFTDHVISFSDTLLLEYEECAQILSELDTIDDENWLKNTVERINLVVFTAALWKEHADLDALGDDYFANIIPAGVKFSDAIIEAYLEVQARLLLHDIQTALDSTNGEEIEVGYLYLNRLGPRREEDYQVPASKDGLNKIIMESERKLNELFDMDLEQFEESCTHERMQKAWRQALFDIESQLQTSHTSHDHQVYNNLLHDAWDGDNIPQKQMGSLDVDDSDHTDDGNGGVYSQSNQTRSQAPLAKPKLTGVQLALAIEDAEEAAKEHFRSAVENVPEEVINEDFQKAPEAPAFLVDIVRPYLLKLMMENTDEDLIDAACDAAASYRDELQIKMKLPIRWAGPLHSDAFRKLVPQQPDLIPFNAITEVSPALPSATDAPSRHQITPKSADLAESHGHNGSHNALPKENAGDPCHTGAEKPNGLSADKVDGPEQSSSSDEEAGPLVNELATASFNSSSEEFCGAPSRSVATAWEELAHRRDVQTNRVWPPRRAGFKRDRAESNIAETPQNGPEGGQQGIQPSTHNVNPSSPSMTAAPTAASTGQKQTKLRRIYRPWTDEELDALSEGMRVYGPQWATIKREYSDALRARSNIDIKDKVRNIVKQRQLDGLPLDHWQISKRG